MGHEVTPIHTITSFKQCENLFREAFKKLNHILNEFTDYRDKITVKQKTYEDELKEFKSQVFDAAKFKKDVTDFRL